MADADPKWWTQEAACAGGSWRMIETTIDGWRIVASWRSAAPELAVWKVYLDTEHTEMDLIHIGDTRQPHDPPTRKIVADLLRRWVVKMMGKAANVLDTLEAG